MGEWERKSKAKPHVQRTDRANSAGADAGVAAEEVYVQCRKISAGTSIVFGASLLLIDRRQPLVSVYINARLVGEVCEEGSQLLRERFGISFRAGQSIEASNVSATESVEFTVRLHL